MLQTPSLRGWGVEKMFVTNSLTGEVWVNLVGSNDLKGEGSGSICLEVVWS